MESSYGPQRIACLQPSATVILNEIGELGRVVACTRYCADVVPEVADSARKIVHDSWTADAEEIVAARPDLMIASVPYQEKAVGEILKAGVRFLGLAPKNLNDIYTDIATIAGVVGRSDRGEQVIAEMKERIAQVRAKTTGSARPRVFCEEWGKPIIASQKWVAELVEAAGGAIIGEPGRQIEAEQILACDPELWIAAWCGAGDRVPLERNIAARNWEEMSATRTGRVYCIRDEFLNTPAPTLLAGLDALAWAIHPAMFERTKGIRQITEVQPAARLNPAV